LEVVESVPMVHLVESNGDSVFQLMMVLSIEVNGGGL
jgi:hypothetical protein